MNESFCPTFTHTDIHTQNFMNENSMYMCINTDKSEGIVLIYIHRIRIYLN